MKILFAESPHFLTFCREILFEVECKLLEIASIPSLEKESASLASNSVEPTIPDMGDLRSWAIMEKSLSFSALSV
nr:hypothetical protein [Desulfonatronovibrio magnus]